jgi:hypothetical protein
MCPACWTAVLLIAGSVTSTGGLIAIGARAYSGKSGKGEVPAQPMQKEGQNG